MKAILLPVFSLLAFLISCSSPAGKGEYTITANIAGLPDGMPVYLQSYGDAGLQNLDTTLAQSGKVEFSGNLESPEMLYMNLGGARKVINVFAENSKISVDANFDDITGAVVRGSASHDTFETFRAYMKPFDEQMEELTEAWTAAGERGDYDKLSEIEATYMELQGDQVNAVKSFVADHRKSFVAPFIIRRYLAYDLDIEELDQVMNGLDKSLNISGDYQFLAGRVALLKKVAVGQPAVDFSLSDTTGTPLALSSFRGKYLLIDFWASWCAPCRKENPSVVRLYEEFKPKGFEILGVSFDTNREAWIQAIGVDGLTWSQVSDLQGWQSEAGQLYAVNSIPHTVLLDPEGVIIAKNLRGDALYDRLSEIFSAGPDSM